jgi:uncharacterized integral membrane protein
MSDSYMSAQHTTMLLMYLNLGTQLLLLLLLLLLIIILMRIASVSYIPAAPSCS